MAAASGSEAVTGPSPAARLDASGALAGRRAVVTGAGSGIGAACARILAGQGAAVALLDVREDAAAVLAGDLAAAGAEAVAARCDVASERSVTAAIDTAVEQLGRIDTVVTAAGIARPADTATLSLDDWDAVIRVNLTGTFLALRHTLGPLVAAGGGAVVTIGSVASLVAAGTNVAYDASKGGVLQLTRAIAAEYAERGVRANCVCPGATATSLADNSQALHGSVARGAGPATYTRTRAPLERRADPEEIATVVAFLCSDEASFMTGAAVPVDGGFTSV